MILLSNIIKAEFVIVDNKFKIHANPIKQEQTESKAISTPREIMYETYNQREIILREAKEEAVKIVNTAKKDAQIEINECKKKSYEDGYNTGREIGKNKGYNEGYNEGYDLGKINALEEIKKHNEARLNELTEMLEIIEEEKEELILKYEKGLSKLAIDIAEKIIRQKIDESSKVISDIIKNAIKDYRNAEWVKVYISGKDEAISVQADRELLKELNKITNEVKFEVSEDLEEGSIIVETPESLVDASINTQLKNLKEMVLSKNEI